MEKTLNDKKAFQATMAFCFNRFINFYAVERVAFGYEKPGDKIPVDLYIKDLPFGIGYLSDINRAIAGVYIDENECINAKYDYDEYVRDLFVYQMEKLFYNAPKDIRLERESKKIPLPPRFRKYLFGLLPLFKEILEVEVEYGVFDVIPMSSAVRFAEYTKWHSFVTAILLKPLRSGSKINKYVKDINNAPHYVSLLIDKQGKNFYLKQIDINRYEYIFALFSLMLFINSENDKLLELKMLEWERRHKSE